MLHGNKMHKFGGQISALHGISALLKVTACTHDPVYVSPGSMVAQKSH